MNEFFVNYKWEILDIKADIDKHLLLKIKINTTDMIIINYYN